MITLKKILFILLVLKNFTIDDWYPSSSLIERSNHEFEGRDLFGMQQDNLTQSMINDWGYTRRSRSYNYVTLQQAYQLYSTTKRYDGDIIGPIRTKRAGAF